MTLNVTISWYLSDVSETAAPVGPGTTDAGPADIGLRERKKERTREALEAAAFDLFERKGFDHTTVEEIADACDVSRRTFFRYFSSKEDAFAGDHEAKTALLTSLLAARPADEPVFESVRMVISGLCQQFGSDKEATLRRMRIAAASHDLQQLEAESYDARLDGLVDALMARGGSPADGDLRLQARLVLGAAIVIMRSVAEQWMADDGQGDLVEMVDNAFDLLIAAFQPRA
jgi:AcrR family transcriptional regulator